MFSIIDGKYNEPISKREKRKKERKKKEKKKKEERREPEEMRWN